MHKDPDKFGFGTHKTNELLTEQATQHRSAIDALTNTMKELTHYIRWATEQTTGKAPPPYVGDAP